MKKILIPFVWFLPVLLMAILVSGNVFATDSNATYKLTVSNQAPSLGSVYQKSGAVRFGKTVTIKAKPSKKYYATIVLDGKIVKNSRWGKSVKYKFKMRTDRVVKVYFTAAGKKFILPPNPVSLSWSVPQRRVNGEELQLSDIHGYQIHYITADKKLSRTISINDPRIVSALVEVPKAGAYYFSIATVDIDGDKSQMSDSVKIIIR